MVPRFPSISILDKILHKFCSIEGNVLSISLRVEWSRMLENSVTLIFDTSPDLLLLNIINDANVDSLSVE